VNNWRNELLRNRGGNLEVLFLTTNIPSNEPTLRYVRLELPRLESLSHAMDFMSKSNSPDMVRALRIAADLRRETHGRDRNEFVKAVKASSERTEALIMILNHLEHLGITVRLQAATEEPLKEYYGVPVRRAWHLYGAWIAFKRVEVQTADLYSEVEFFAKRWVKK